MPKKSNLVSGNRTGEFFLSLAYIRIYIFIFLKKNKKNTKNTRTQKAKETKKENRISVGKLRG